MTIFQLNSIQPILYLLLLISCGNVISADQQERQVGGPCEGCEATMEFGDRTLHSTDTLPGAGRDTTALVIEGTVFQKDERTPAEGVIIYIHHTDQQGLYQLRDDAEEWRNSGTWARRHGSLRGWVKTDHSGKYAFITQRPAPYPTHGDPAHIHMFLKEEGLKPYYIDDILFDDDPLLTQEERDEREERGGPGIVRPELMNDTLHVTRDIILGRNVPGY